MEIGYIVNELWRLKRWVAIGLAVAFLAALSVMYKLPSFETKSFELGAASTEVIVEPANSPLGLLGSDPQTASSLVTQAGLYASLLSAPPVKEIIGKKVGIPGAYIATSGQPTGGGGQTGREVAAEQRGNELIVEANIYRILSSTRPDLPLISIFTQAPTAEDAVRLANAAVEGLTAYVDGVATKEGAVGRLRLRQLGSATGGLITSHASAKVALLSFIGAFAAWCVLVLVVTRLRSGWRVAQARERAGARGAGDADGRPRAARDDVAA